jgi:MFS family permease
MTRITFKNWTLIWLLGMAGQLCWNVENSWFNTFVYAKIAPDPYIISWMVGASAAVTTFSAFLIGTSSDRAGKRKPFIAVGYILWGVFTIVFGATEFLPKSPMLLIMVVVVASDAVMSFFGSMGYDGAFCPWTTDISNEHNRGKIGGAFAAMPVLATIFGAVVSGIVIDAIDFFPFFIVMGTMVALAGLATLFFLKDDPELKPKKDGGFWRQFFSVFKYKTLAANPELFWVFVVMLVYFISFNVYFPYITIYFTNYIGLDYSMTGIIQGVGLLAAVLFTFPASRFIDGGKAPAVILVAVVVSCAGLLVISFNTALVPMFAGVFGAGLGYILMMQTLTAWIKNLFPEDQRGQFEGVRSIFATCVPMVVGPAVASFTISQFGVRKIVNGVEGPVPTGTLFLISTAMTVLTLAPLVPAARRFGARKARQASGS